ncbi:uncharacterized protein V1518DRAFT_381479 [Limtongia smithiae]|uniref:uncharacterized protein n=1 Tax=Limtongia smithiae TaxID=1125753 RepID=UPI0034CD6D26
MIPAPMALLAHVLAYPSFSERRLPSLYSDFRRLKEVNPDGYEANVQAWRDVLASAVRAGLCGSAEGGQADMLVLQSGEKFLSALTSSSWGKPLALSAVLNEQVAARNFIPITTFLTQATIIYTDPQWRVLRYSKAIATWALRDSVVHEYYAIASAIWRRSGSDEKLPEIRFVVLQNVETAARVLVERVRRAAERCGGRYGGVYTVEFVKRSFSKDPFGQTTAVDDGDESKEEGTADSVPSLSDTDFAVLLKFLERDTKQAIITDSIIKFPLTISAPLTPLTEDERVFAQLRSLIHTLTTRIAQQHLTALSARSKASEYITTCPQTAHLRSLALMELKRSKQAASRVTDLMQRKLQLESVMNSIETAHDNVEMAKIMERTLPVLESLNANAGGSVEKVADLVAKVTEQVETTEEIGCVLAGSVSGAAVDDAEIEDELAKMAVEEKAVSVQELKPKQDTSDLATLLAGASLEDVPDISPNAPAAKEQAVLEIP